MSDIIIPKTVNEQLLYATLKVIGEKYIGTGFIFNIKVDEEKNCLVILTNKHVVEDETKVTIPFHLSDANDQPTKTTYSASFVLEKLWVPHPEADIDLGAIFLEPLKQSIFKDCGRTIYTRSFHEDCISSDENLREKTDVADEVLMIGYPIGLCDEIHNYPIFRRGICASHPGIDFDGHPIGVVDIACFKGSSGSPIIMYKQNYIDKYGNQFFGVDPMFFLLGVLFKGPKLTETGEIEIRNVPSSKTELITDYSQMIHLGFYIKAKKILELIDIIKDRINKGDTHI